MLEKSVFLTRPIVASVIETIRSHCRVVDMNPDDRTLAREELLRGVHGRDGVLCQLTDHIDEEVFEAAGPQCRIFANYAVGYNNIDVPAATRRGVLVTNTPDVLTDATADIAWALILAVARRVVEGDRFFRSGQWNGWGPLQFLGGDVTGATLGIVGAGRIGTATALRSAGFRMNVLYTSSRDNRELTPLGARRVDLQTILKESDFVSLHVPLTPQTRHLIGPPQLSMMKPTAYLINTSRGPIVDEAALVQFLREKRIAGAGLDVYENEPEPAPGLIDLDNVVCIPHLGSATQATRTKMGLMAVNNLIAALKDETPPNLLNPEALKVHK